LCTTFVILNLFQDLKYMKQYCVYIVTNKTNSTLYIGVTSNLPKRIYEHKNKLADGFTKKYNVNKLVYFEQTENVQSALKREKQLKNWHRNWKTNLINSVNPEWRDLASTLLDNEIMDARP
jgi:putative endonuclease